MFTQIWNISESVLLSDFLRDNQDLIEKFASCNIDVQRQQQDAFEQFVLLKSNVINSLDFGQTYNRAFVSILFDFAERTNSLASALRLYYIIQEHDIDVGSRLEAAMLYLFNVPENQVFIDRFDEICSKLQTAINEEEDDDRKAVSTFLNYYSYVVYNTAPHIQFAQQLQSKIISSSAKYSFLNNDIIQQSIALDVNQAESVYTTIQNSIDSLLGHCLIAISNKVDGVLMETDTDYCRSLAVAPRKFAAIRQIAIRRLDSIINLDAVYRSLQRGVAILKQEEQLFHYVKSYGLMHEAKLKLAFSNLSFDDFGENSIEVIDWSCGQGMASIVLLEYLREHHISLAIERVTLIEPSVIALKRASLHVRHFNPDIAIKTISKDMDSLNKRDVCFYERRIRMHLFSNILDVESFSMRHLIELIKQSNKGLNYFICVSPFINDVKTARIDSFVHGFDKETSFELLYEDEARAGEWVNQWTKVIRVFRVCLM